MYVFDQKYPLFGKMYHFFSKNRNTYIFIISGIIKFILLTTSYKNISKKSSGIKDWQRHILGCIQKCGKNVILCHFCNKFYSETRNTVIFLLHWEKQFIIGMPQTQYEQFWLTPCFRRSYDLKNALKTESSAL